VGDGGFVPPRLSNPKLISQGAEALLFEGLFDGEQPCVAKHRFSKKYRHPVIDEHALDHRTRSEARILALAQRSGAPVPQLLAEDISTHTLYLEKLPGPTVTEAITQHGVLQNPDVAVPLARDIGNSIALLHNAGIIHNDLTMSNIVLRYPYSEVERLYALPPAERPEDGNEGSQKPQGPQETQQPVGKRKRTPLQVPRPLTAIIDFGLSSTGKLSYETRAVDLYVLEKSLLALCGETEMFSGILDAYSQAFREAGPSQAAALEQALQRFQIVRARGRKR